jgi:beta-galactosidase
MDRAGNPKDAYYVFKSYWSDDPFVYIESHTWKERSGPEDLKRNMSIYSNAEVVELFVNNESLGKKEKDISKFPAGGLNWDVAFQAGGNSIKAIGYLDGKKVAEDNLEVNYRFEKAGSPQELALEYSEMDNGNFLVSVVAKDKNGLRCLDYQDKVYFQCLKGGRLMKSQGTPTGSSVISMANGKASIVVVPNSSEQNVEVTLLNQNFKGSFLSIPKNSDAAAMKMK